MSAVQPIRASDPLKMNPAQAAKDIVARAHEQFEPMARELSEKLAAEAAQSAVSKAFLSALQTNHQREIEAITKGFEVRELAVREAMEHRKGGARALGAVAGLVVGMILGAFAALILTDNAMTRGVAIGRATAQTEELREEFNKER